MQSNNSNVALLISLCNLNSNQSFNCLNYFEILQDNFKFPNYLLAKYLKRIEYDKRTKKLP
jgi:hypothetical protein